MEQPSQINAIKSFLLTNTHPDLANLYNPNMEVQVIVQQKDGIRIDSEYKGKAFHKYSNGIQTWGPIRIPYNANTDTPEYDLDKPMTWNLSEYALGIGMTGWRWIDKKSVYVAYDYDALSGHSDKHTKRLTDEQLAEITNIIYKIPWIQIRRSTGGKGLHLYIFFDPTNLPTTTNHTQHAALARAILGKLSLLCNYDFASRTDGGGGSNMWIWHKKMIGTDGLTIIKPSTEFFTNIPTNWQDHVPVVLGKRHRSLIPIESDENIFDEMTGQRTRIKLDPQHTRLLDYLSNSRFISYFDSERWMLVTHTYAIKEAYHDLALIGIYETISIGTDPSSPNSFAFPNPDGSWVIRRFTPKVAEANIWEEDSKGFMRCYINRVPTLEIAAKINQGSEHKSGGYIFPSATYLLNTLKLLGYSDESIPEAFITQSAKLKKIKDNKLLAEIKHSTEMKGSSIPTWYKEKDNWCKIFNINQTSIEPKYYEHDDSVRHLVSSDGADAGWVVKPSSNEQWNQEPYIHVRLLLEGKYNYDNKQLKSFLGSNIDQPWIIVNEPFQPEYLDNRRWNRNAAQFKFIPSTTDNPEHPTWNVILQHCGKSLDLILQHNDWAQINNILTGADYLRAWIASAFQKPNEPLPYLFFYGPENSGKSIFHEALSLLITKGYVRADNTLKSSSGFNGELEGALFAIIEETNFKADKVANQRIKDWITSIKLSIHHKHRTPYNVTNTCKWIQAANDASFCPVFTGDTRVTFIEVLPFDSESEIPKRILLERLEKEASDFLSSIIHINLPPITGRLSIPVIETPDKLVVQNANRTPAEEFFEEQTYYWPGHTILYQDLYQAFCKSIDGQERAVWSIRKFGSCLPSKYVKGRLKGGDPSWVIGNISLTKPTNDQKFGSKLILTGQYLTEENHDA